MASCVVRLSEISSRYQCDRFVCSLFPEEIDCEFELLSQKDGYATLLFPSKRKALFAINHINRNRFYFGKEEIISKIKATLVAAEPRTKPIPWTITVAGVSGTYQNGEAFRSLFPNSISFDIEKFNYGTAVLYFPSKNQARKMEVFIDNNNILGGKIRIISSKSNLSQKIIPGTALLHSFVSEELADDVEYDTVDKNLKHHLRCSICLDLMKKPHRIVECGHAFCKQCLPINAKCHTCRKQIQSPPTPDFILESITSSMSIYCIYSSGEGGCEWNGTLPTLKNHLKTCPLHDVRCNLCSWKGTRSQSVGHTKTCNRTYSPCKNESRGCSFLGTKQQIAIHLKECPNEVISCSNESLGCPTSSQRHLFPASHATTCRYRKVTCSDCQVSLLNSEIANHDAICRQKQRECENCSYCGTIQELRSHKKKCNFRVVVCRYCDCPYQANRKKQHQCPIFECKFERYGCPFLGVPTAVAKHERNCGLQPVHLLCGRTIFAQDKFFHAEVCEMCDDFGGRYF